MLLGRERNFRFGERGGRRVAVLAEFVESGAELGDEFLGGLLAHFARGHLLGEGGALGVPFLLLRGEALNFVNDGVDLLVQDALGILQRLELAFVRGDGDFLSAQFSLGLLKAGLQRGLFALKHALAAADFRDLFLQDRELSLEFLDLIFAAENGRGSLAVAVAVDLTAGIDAVTVEQFAGAGDVIKLALRLAPSGGSRCEVVDNDPSSKQRGDERADGVVGFDDGERERAAVL